MLANLCSSFDDSELQEAVEQGRVQLPSWMKVGGGDWANHAGRT